jgi:sugar phosphate isomerase/epimerase
MFETGLVSVSFRGESPERILQEMVDSGLKYIEWGSDVHAPCEDAERLQEIVKLQKQYGITCCSYGTYFRLCVTPIEELPKYIHAAKTLGTNILRLWVGDKSPWLWTQEEKTLLFAQSRQAAKMAEQAGVILCMECHRNTFTETKEASLELMNAVNSPAFIMYWQPHSTNTQDENIAYIRSLRDYTTHIHSYYWKDGGKYTLAGGIEEWRTYLREFSGDHKVLLEFMPDGRIESLRHEAQILKEIIAGV